MVAGFVVASIYAVGMLKGRRDRYHRLGFTIAFAVAAIATPLQIAVGDYAARAVHDEQPAKFAAMELVTETGTNRALHLGGVLVDGKVRGAITVPGLDSILAGGSRATKVVGLNDVPADERPPANLVHLSFQLMVAIGFALVGLAAWFGLAWWRRKTVPASPWFLRGAAAAGAASIAALEAGWVTTELGRQPWIAYKLMRTSEAVTHVGGVWVSYGIIVALYAAVITGAIVVLRHMARRWRDEELSDPAVPYGPRPQLMVDAP
jgi:cytochrome d ubiquinol oxidase subunit I